MDGSNASLLVGSIAQIAQEKEQYMRRLLSELTQRGPLRDLRNILGAVFMVVGSTFLVLGPFPILITSGLLAIETVARKEWISVTLLHKVIFVEALLLLVSPWMGGFGFALLATH